MTPETPAPATLESLLRKVIEAQEKGGCDTWAEYPLNGMSVWLDGVVVCNEFSCMDRQHVLQILLDTEGAKAAWGKQEQFYPFDPVHATGENIVRGIWVTRAILNAWHSGSGNNVRAALETAVSLLPKA